MSINKCKFCNSTFQPFGLPGNKDVEGINCPLCGYYSITRTALYSDFNPDITEEEKLLMCGYLRNNSGLGQLIMIDSGKLNNIKEIVAPYKALSIDEKIDLAIRYIAENTKQIGNPVDTSRAFPIFYLKNEGELWTMLDWLEKMNFGKKYGKDGFILEPKGWQRYDEIKKINIKSRQVFVAMNFKPELEYIFTDAIEPACKECDFFAVRVDRLEHNQKICDKIIAEIKRSKFLIADFTDQRYGVYFEAGFAYALGIPVIWTCKKGEEDKLHFDTRQYSHIIWEDQNDLKERLINRIEATIK